MKDTKEKILNTALLYIPTAGFNEKAFEDICIQLNLDKHLFKLLFPKGIAEFIEFYCQQADKEMLQEIAKLDLENMKIRDKIGESVQIRISIYNRNKLFVKKLVEYLSLPWNLIFSGKLAWNTADLIWCHAAKDNSVDYNYYTKRTLLVGVISSTMLFWLADKSDDWQNTKDFLQNRIADVLKAAGFLRKMQTSSVNSK